MGSFIGHAAPGSFFLVCGLWWAFSCLRRHLVCRRDGVPFVSTAIFGLAVFPEKPVADPKAESSSKGCFRRYCLTSIPLEAAVKIVFSILGIVMEIGGHLPPPIPSRIIQHSTMYGMFLTAGLVDVGFQAGLPFPDGLQHAGMALALAVEGLLFASHVHGREILDIHLHMLLVKVIAATVLVMILEIIYRKSAILTMTRAYLLMLQGSWFWAVAVILYKHGPDHPTWDLTSAKSVMEATIYFSWHCAAIFILLLVMNVVMGLYYGGQGRATGLATSGTELSPMDQAAHKEYAILSADDSDDDNMDAKDIREEEQDSFQV